ILVPPGDVYRRLPEEFQKKYGIQVETLAGNGNVDLVPRVNAERQAGQYNWDLVTHSPGSMLTGFRRLGAMEPLAPALVLAVAVLVLTLGEERVRQFLELQQPVLTTDRRQLGEWIVRGGQYPIALGVAPDSFGAFRSQGVDTTQIKALDPDNVKGAVFTAGT